MLINGFDGPFRIGDRRFDLASVSHDASICEEAVDIRVVVGSHNVEVESIERRPEVLPLAKDGQPAQTGLEALQTDLLEEPLVIELGEPPLGVVIDLVVGIPNTPPAAPSSVAPIGDLHQVPR